MSTIQDRLATTIQNYAAHIRCIFAQLSTYALTLFRKEVKINEDDLKPTVIGEKPL